MRTLACRYSCRFGGYRPGWRRLPKQVFELFARVTAELQLNVERKDFEEMFAKFRAQDRVYHVARSIISVTNILGTTGCSGSCACR